MLKPPGILEETILAMSEEDTRWGLGSGRQDGVLLLALTMEPAARLGSEADAKAYLVEATGHLGGDHSGDERGRLFAKLAVECGLHRGTQTCE
jgi:hypothetical protein